ncbi:carboxylate/amino acid/amine transporter [Hartmannibacter diazotrophicus]|uniref:Carboxylate/amino acid/amine transporter n=1 Tax=Hartmannibacter diazotrophicus TaxID=1482074 RepID=A0A2C9D4G0_9HYPH|nr:DMT family transporter [Hartmannibacter diazotrophicus]SON55069.1 carboxylate/amino acid/amine transporter [Hartmannibacter diazotrophicus]
MRNTDGWLSGFLGMLIFSGSMAATRLAVTDFDPVFLTVARGAIAGSLAALILLVCGAKRPRREDLMLLGAVAVCVVAGFPLLTAFALQEITSAHSLVFIALLPLSTALFAVLRGNERPGLAFWLFALTGSGLVIGYAALPGLEASPRGDLLMLGAVVLCGFGYAQGGVLARRLGGWQVICWALVLAAPAMGVLAILTRPPTFHDVGLSAWAGLAYVSLFSMLIGFIFWYRGLALGGIASVGQLQLLQPFFGLAIAASLMREPVSASMLLVTTGVIACVAGARRFAARQPASPAPTSPVLVQPRPR